MLSMNDAEKIVSSLVDGAVANTKMNVVAKSMAFTIADGAVDFARGDKFTFTISQNPPAATSPAAATGNTGNGVCGAVTLVGECPNETWTLTCIATAANGGTFKAVGSKSGELAARITVGVAYTHVFQQIEPGDKIISALYHTDAGAKPVCKKSTITIVSGGVESSDNLNAGDLELLWLDMSAG